MGHRILRGAGSLQTVESFRPGIYTLTFDLEGNARGDVAKTTTITLGDWSTSLTLDSSAPYTLYTHDVGTTGGQLSFAEDGAGNQATGNFLDNVNLSSATSATQAVADPVSRAIHLGNVGVGLCRARIRGLPVPNARHWQTLRLLKRSDPSQCWLVQTVNSNAVLVLAAQRFVG